MQIHPPLQRSSLRTRAINDRPYECLRQDFAFPNRIAVGAIHESPAY